ncbi:MAG: hypothetical protein RQ826_08940 [Xanthomonadales bacterium]|nr:hypothetical protein [Xanthomonadales bacterium]
MSSGACILTINGGSSSIKFAVYRMYGEQPRKGLRGKIDRIGLQGTHFTFDDPTRKQQGHRGIGENAPAIRARICEGLGFLDLQIDESRNAAGKPVVSADQGRVEVRVIRTDEDAIIAKAVFGMLAGAETGQHAHPAE